MIEEGHMYSYLMSASSYNFNFNMRELTKLVIGLTIDFACLPLLVTAIFFLFIGCLPIFSSIVVDLSNTLEIIA